MTQRLCDLVSDHLDTCLTKDTAPGPAPRWARGGGGGGGRWGREGEEGVGGGVGSGGRALHHYFPFQSGENMG